jgi:hypothetical protein
LLVSIRAGFFLPNGTVVCTVRRRRDNPRGDRGETGVDWRDRLRELGEKLASGEITTVEYRALSDGVLADADREAAATTAPTDPPTDTPADAQKRVHIPTSAAWEAPSGEMTQIVGTQDHTTVVPQRDEKRDPAD